MAEKILVIAEQREGKLNRVSFETLAGAQALAKQTGWTVEAAVVGSNIASVAAEIAKTAVAKVYAIEDKALEQYTPDGFVTALKTFIELNKPKLVLLPHTYQVRDFAPKLAAALGAVLVSDAVGCKFEDGKLLFTRQMFQGKFAADISLAGDGPWFASFQTGAFRGDQVEAGRGARRTGAAPAPARFARNLRLRSRRLGRRSILRRPRLSSRWGAALKSRRTLRLPRPWPMPWAERLRPRAPSATRAGCRWSARSVRADRP